MVLPSTGWPEERQERAITRVVEMMGDSLTLAAREPANFTWLDREVGSLSAQSFASFDAVVAAPEELDSLQAEGIERLYKVTPDGLVQLADGRLDSREFPGLDDHVFNRVSGRRNGEFKFFPYGFLGHHAGRGPINAFGYRISHSDQELEELADRDPDVRVIAVFGGSAAFSTHCGHEEMWPSVLERRLNENEQEAASSTVVLNFGQVGALVLNGITSWVLHCHRLKPDLVIAHTGWNDLAMGPVCDPYLVADHQIAYVTNLEEWARRLHDAPDEPLANPERPMRFLSHPEDAVIAYLDRMDQFRQLVEGMGAGFVCGLQPIFASKAELSPQEDAAIKSGANNPDLALVFERISKLFDMASERLNGRSGLVDLHRDFSAYGAERTLFADRVHLWPEGDAAVAEAYAQFLS